MTVCDFQGQERHVVSIGLFLLDYSSGRSQPPQENTWTAQQRHPCGKELEPSAHSQWGSPWADRPGSDKPSVQFSSDWHLVRDPRAINTSWSPLDSCHRAFCERIDVRVASRHLSSGITFLSCLRSAVWLDSLVLQLTGWDSFNIHQPSTHSRIQKNSVFPLI